MRVGQGGYGGGFRGDGGVTGPWEGTGSQEVSEGSWSDMRTSEPSVGNSGDKGGHEGGEGGYGRIRGDRGGP